MAHSVYSNGNLNYLVRNCTLPIVIFCLLLYINFTLFVTSEMLLLHCIHAYCASVSSYVIYMMLGCT